MFAQICLEINLDSTKTLSHLISKDSYQSVGKQDIFDDDVRIALAKKKKVYPFTLKCANL